MSERFFLVLWLVVLAFLGGCETVEKTREVGYKGPARLNDFLAAERFLEEMGLEVRGSAIIPPFSENKGAAFIVPLEVLESDGLIWELSDWVSGGGHLYVYLPDERYRILELIQDNDFLEYFDVGVALNDWSVDPVEISSSRGYYEGGVNFKTDFKIETSLSDTSDLSSLPEWYQSFSWDEGSVTVFGTSAPFRNRVLGEEQHASLLWSFFEQHTGKVFFVRGEQPKLFAMMWRANPFAFVIGVLAVVLLVWWAARGLGPRYDGSVEPEPQLDEHLHATGNFLRRQKAEGEVLGEVKTAVIRKLARNLNLPPLTTEETVLNAAYEKQIISAEDYAILSSKQTDQTSLNFYRDLQQLQKQT